MRRLFPMGLALIALVSFAGCRGTRSAARPTFVASEPPLIVSGGDPIVRTTPGSASSTIADSGTHVISSNQSTTVDRNPMLSRPRDYYETTEGGKVRKTLAAGFIGVPSGIGAQVKQLVTGEPAPQVSGASNVFSSAPAPSATVSAPVR